MSSVRSHRCDRCGAPTKSATARCSSCGAVPVVVASGFGTSATTWEVTPPVDKTRVVVLDDNELRAGLPPRSEVPGWTMGCAWTRDDFVEADVTAPIAFETTPDGLGAGIWLRSSNHGCLQVMLDHLGAVTMLIERRGADGVMAQTSFGHRISPAPGFRAGATTVLRARLVRDLVYVFVDGVPRGSWRCPTDLVGSVYLFVHVAKSERAIVRFLDPTVTLPV